MECVGNERKGRSEGEACVHARYARVRWCTWNTLYECDLICGGSDVIGAAGVRVSIRAHTHTHTHTRGKV